mmetsp:Transcript_42006/g.89694  ORF Transcript_42006/g.89694 Transcript_42006/m.89694 type:complete len:124 (-) Transcript_42006:360-731(-)|eukprot:CAMPEP_0183360158 /NCGR_PEP_ID=MMETSP0164_2-20130417/54470_1 /TAXON_ID=221442 /ORGANISM="Coccolithus pelagicus ssp braarudi, Strain PLY182g" /LENGTH=123 /DNA_ID=CAMNT_0025534455 /DNA_START=980 /DNA_END=1351 /DNA_ORIENTATION=-
MPPIWSSLHMCRRGGIIDVADGLGLETAGNAAFAPDALEESKAVKLSFDDAKTTFDVSRDAATRIPPSTLVAALKPVKGSTHGWFAVIFSLIRLTGPTPIVRLVQGSPQNLVPTLIPRMDAQK